MTIRTNAYERSLEPIQVQRSLEHQMVHEGRTYVVDVNYGSIGSATNNIVFRTNNATVVHLRGLFSFNESGNHLITLYENPTITNLGNAQTIISVNRYTPEQRDSTVNVYRDSDITNPGTQIKIVYDFAKTGSGSLQNDAVPEFILNKNSNYYIKSQHYTPAGNVALSIAWYEFEH